MKHLKIHLITISIIFLLFGCSANKEGVKRPQWEKEVLKTIEKSMSDYEHKKAGDVYQVTSYKMKPLEFHPGKIVEADGTVDVIHISKNEKLLVTITSGSEGGHEILIFGNLDQDQSPMALMVTDSQGDGIYDRIGQFVYDESGNSIQSFYDENYDGYCETVIDVKNHKAYVRIDGEMRELLKLNGKQYIKCNEELKEIEKMDNDWGYKTGDD